MLPYPADAATGAAFAWRSLTMASISITSAPIILTVLGAPAITLQPVSQTSIAGSNVTFSIFASGAQPLSYQWRSNGVDITDAGNVSGSTSSILTILNATERNNAAYSVLVTNALGSVPSTGAVLTIIPASAPGTRLMTLYSFTGTNDGGFPNALTVGTNGILYGTTQFRGRFFAGTVFTAGTNGVVRKNCRPSPVFPTYSAW